MMDDPPEPYEQWPPIEGNPSMGTGLLLLIVVITSLIAGGYLLARFIL
jgi:hypothetical protein